MALRIHDSVMRGEIDNRTKGIVHGKVWLESWDEPLTLELAGNAHSDLAGCLLTFINLGPHLAYPHLDSLAREQRGAVGDLTASRKARVADMSIDEALAMSDRKEKAPEHLANSPYLEWFSETNGRVVIESADYKLTISAPTWQLTAEENAQRARDVAEAMDAFLQNLTDAIEQHKRDQKDPEEQWDEHDYERFLKESDARTEKYGELLDKYGDFDEAESTIAKAMGWERELTEEEAEALGLERLADKDLDDFVFEFQTTSVKLGGALDGIAQSYDFRDPAFTVAYLKRALAHLHKAQAGLEGVAPKNLLPNDMVAEARQELFAIREGILELMDEMRGPAYS